MANAINTCKNSQIKIEMVAICEGILEAAFVSE